MSAAAHRRDNRVFRYAVLLSIALHGLILFGFFKMDAARRAESAPSPIAARLVEQPASLVPPQAEAQPAPPPEKPQLPAVNPPAKPDPSPKAPPQPAVAAPPAEPPPASPEPPRAAPSAAAPQPAAPAARSGAEIEADTVGRFRMQVIEAARKFMRYPPAARDNNWEGRADVRVSFGADGRRRSVVIVRSSGQPILDRQAIDTVIQADVPVPAGLRGKEFAFEIPVIFNLKDAPSG